MQLVDTEWNKITAVNNAIYKLDAITLQTSPNPVFARNIWWIYILRFYVRRKWERKKRNYNQQISALYFAIFQHSHHFDMHFFSLYVHRLKWEWIIFLLIVHHLSIKHIQRYMSATQVKKKSDMITRQSNWTLVNCIPLKPKLLRAYNVHSNFSHEIYVFIAACFFSLLLSVFNLQWKKHFYWKCAHVYKSLNLQLNPNAFLNLVSISTWCICSSFDYSFPFYFQFYFFHLPTNQHRLPIIYYYVFFCVCVILFFSSYFFVEIPKLLPHFCY